jgi:hypothetical protein
MFSLPRLDSVLQTAKRPQAGADCQPMEVWRGVGGHRAKQLQLQQAVRQPPLRTKPPRAARGRFVPMPYTITNLPTGEPGA